MVVVEQSLGGEIGRGGRKVDSVMWCSPEAEEVAHEVGVSCTRASLSSERATRENRQRALGVKKPS